MKSNKDISDLIRENAHKLEEQPSADAWQRLESRLDQKASKRSFSIRRVFSIAASAVGLIGFGFAISFMFERGDMSEANIKRQHSIESATVSEFTLEKLEGTKDEDQGFYKIIEFQKTYQDRLSNPIVEGSGKKLTVANNRK